MAKPQDIPIRQAGNDSKNPEKGKNFSFAPYILRKIIVNTFTAFCSLPVYIQSTFPVSSLSGLFDNIAYINLRYIKFFTGV